MPAINLSDLNNAKLDVDHIGAIATSLNLTATDRKGRSKLTVLGAVTSLAAFIPRGPFMGATPYALKELYTSGGIVYVAIEAHVSTSVAADLAAGRVTVHQGATREDLGALSGAAMVGFDGSLNYAAGTLGAQFFGEVNLKSYPWLCVLDGIADDTAGFHAALTFAKARGYRVYHPGGVCRVTSGFTQNTVRHNVAIFGPARTGDDTNLNLGAIFLLDSTDPASFFFSLAASSHLFSSDVRYRCAQFVKDRAFFKYSAASFNHRFHSVAFERIERPHVYKPGAYFQISSFVDVQFNDSGTFHSEVTSGASLGNLMTLVNVSHDGSVPDNTEKIVCNLQGIRGIQGSNFMLEGMLPAAGWTVLKLANPYSATWTQDPIIQVNGWWSEWTGNSPDYVVDQSGGRAIFNMGTFNLGPVSRKYRLTDKAQVSINNAPFIAGAGDYVNSMFVFENQYCHAVLEQCTLRYVDRADERFTFRDCTFSPDGSASSSDLGSALFDTGHPTLIYKWAGGYIDGANAGIYLQAATTYMPSTDTVYNRKLSIIPAGNALNVQLQTNLRGVVAVGTQYHIVALVKLPVFTSGAINITPAEDNTVLTGGAGYSPEYSGQVVKVNISRRMSVASNVVAMRAVAIGVSGMAGNMEIYAFAIYAGNGAPRFEYPAYPMNIITYNTAAPTAGSWARGDKVINGTPSVGVPKVWTCTLAGTPGTWVSEGNL